ncbi:Hypothetical protein POVN_LOCUS342 [uncultured virus]|nr:Hypothetical protein POVN_LOCUS342 [uncultured virus]
MSVTVTIRDAATLHAEAVKLLKEHRNTRCGRDELTLEDKKDIARELIKTGYSFNQLADLCGKANPVRLEAWLGTHCDSWTLDGVLWTTWLDKVDRTVPSSKCVIL